jgi:hypothetical protein
MTLEYWRELGVSWGLDEINVLRNVRKVDNILIKSELFNVKGKKKSKRTRFRDRSASGRCDRE